MDLGLRDRERLDHLAPHEQVKATPKPPGFPAAGRGLSRGRRLRDPHLGVHGRTEGRARLAREGQTPHGGEGVPLAEPELVSAK